MLLDVLASQVHASASPPPQAVPDLRDAVAERLQAWHRRVARDGARYAELDDVSRHRLRKRVKRLRYAAEFAASLYKGKAVGRYLARLAPAQDSLGRYNDLCVGLATYREAVGDDPRAWFAIGWLTARRDALLADSVAALRSFARCEPFWKGLARRRPNPPAAR
jgi:CHAD domain-containing protein